MTSYEPWCIGVDIKYHKILFDWNNQGHIITRNDVPLDDTAVIDSVHSSYSYDFSTSSSNNDVLPSIFFSNNNINYDFVIDENGEDMSIDWTSHQHKTKHGLVWK